MNKFKKTQHDIPSRHHIGASSQSFFYYLSISHWRDFETLVASYLCHLSLSQWRGFEPIMWRHLSTSYWRGF